MRTQLTIIALCLMSIGCTAHEPQIQQKTQPICVGMKSSETKRILESSGLGRWTLGDIMSADGTPAHLQGYALNGEEAVFIEVNDQKFAVKTILLLINYKKGKASYQWNEVRTVDIPQVK